MEWLWNLDSHCSFLWSCTFWNDSQLLCARLEFPAARAVPLSPPHYLPHNSFATSVPSRHQKGLETGGTEDMRAGGRERTRCHREIETSDSHFLEEVFPCGDCLVFWQFFTIWKVISLNNYREGNLLLILCMRNLRSSMKLRLCYLHSYCDAVMLGNHWTQGILGTCHYYCFLGAVRNLETVLPSKQHF